MLLEEITDEERVGHLNFSRCPIWYSTLVAEQGGPWTAFSSLLQNTVSNEK